MFHALKTELVNDELDVVCRSKEVIPLERVLVVNPIGNDPLTMKSKEAYHTMIVVYLVWPTKEKIPMARNCKLLLLMHTQAHTYNTYTD